jgi:hypothetical protein
MWLQFLKFDYTELYYAFDNQFIVFITRMKGAIMNSNLEEIREQLRKSKNELLKRENVVATGLGYKTVAGKTTQELSLICSVEVKKPKHRLAKNDLVPPLIYNIPTDVKPVGTIRAQQPPTGRFRPAPGGVSVGHFQITAGTLGCLVKKDGNIYILSNNHVLANSNEAAVNDVILQPGPYDGGQNPADQIAVLSEFIPISFVGDNDGNGDSPACGVASSITSVLNTLAGWTGSSTRLRQYRIQQETDNIVDCAIARVLNPQNVSNEILGFGKINGTQQGELGMAIKKSGRTTGLTNGIIEQIDVTAQVSYGTNKTAIFTNQLLAGAMSQGGDSGSAVLDNNNNLVGLLFAGSDSTTIINRIENVFSLLDVTLL